MSAEPEPAPIASGLGDIPRVAEPEAGRARTGPLVRAPERVRRWEEFGGTWRVLDAGAASATVELRRCDGGELVETLRLDEPREVRWAWAHAQRAMAGDPGPVAAASATDGAVEGGRP